VRSGFRSRNTAHRYEAFLSDTIDWGGVMATYIGIPLFLIIWFGYKLVKGTRFVRYSEMEFPGRFKK
jgi:lysine-specific permease